MGNNSKYSFVLGAQLGFWSWKACRSLVTLKRASLMEWKRENLVYFRLHRSPGNVKHEGCEAVQPLSSQ